MDESNRPYTAEELKDPLMPRSMPEPWKPYTDHNELERAFRNGEVRTPVIEARGMPLPDITLETLDADIAAGRLTKTEIKGPPIDETCETCGSRVQYQDFPISGYKGWWMFIGHHKLGKAYVPHTPADCAQIKARGDEARGVITNHYTTSKATPWTEVKNNDD